VPATYNGSYLIQGRTDTTISFGRLADSGPFTSGGTVWSPDVLSFNATSCY
jgi:hypothetical protein